MPAELVLATWNINSVRLRRPIVERLLNEIEPDVLCLQETKCQDGQFPAADFRKIGYPYVALNGGRGGYHGVAIVSRLPLGDIKARDFCGKGGDPRHVSAVVEVGGTALRLHNFYVPAGGDEPDASVNPKFEHKLRFLDEMAAWLPETAADLPSVVVGDLNVAHTRLDVANWQPVFTASGESAAAPGQNTRVSYETTVIGLTGTWLVWEVTVDREKPC